jgi:hypothetical protein
VCEHRTYAHMRVRMRVRVRMCMRARVRMQLQACFYMHASSCCYRGVDEDLLGPLDHQDQEGNGSRGQQKELITYDLHSEQSL